MTTRVADKQPEVKNLANQMEFELALEFARVVEDAAIASAHTMGTGDRERADQVATEAMRTTMDSVPMRGTIVIGRRAR
jgi:fructose-1,6-bisphosphatase II